MNNDDNLSVEEVKRIEDYVSRLGISNRILGMDFGGSFSQKIETTEIFYDASTEKARGTLTP